MVRYFQMRYSINPLGSTNCVHFVHTTNIINIVIFMFICFDKKIIIISTILTGYFTLKSQEMFSAISFCRNVTTGVLFQ